MKAATNNARRAKVSPTPSYLLVRTARNAVRAVVGDAVGLPMSDSDRAVLVAASRILDETLSRQRAMEFQWRSAA